MANGMIPPGYTAVLVASVSSYEELNIASPLEESTEEGTLVLTRLDFAEPPSAEELVTLEQSFADTGVTRWPGNSAVVYLNTEDPSSIYLAWQKGIAWMPIVIGILIVAVLPLLLGAFVWWLLPQGIKDLITGIVNIAVLFLIMILMTRIMPGKEPKKIGSRET